MPPLNHKPSGRPVLVAFLPVLLLLTSCSTVKGFFSDGVVFGGQARLDVRVADDLNHDYPVAVELLVVYDGDLEKELVELDARTWFEQRQQYRDDFSQEQYQSWYWEWAPGQVVAPQQFRYEAGAISAIIFAGYKSPGAHRKRVSPPNQHMSLTLRKDDFKIGPG